MPSITCSLEPGGPIVTVLLGPSVPRLTVLREAGAPAPTPVTGKFLIDTGASSTCVDPQLIEPLGLPQIGKVAISTPSTNGGHHYCEQYDASIFIPGALNAPGFAIPAIPIITTHLRSQGIDGLIGRDILNRCTLIYCGSPPLIQLNF